MEIDIPEVVAEVRAAFDRYERAVRSNDPAGLSEAFWRDGRTLRYGIGENLYGWDEIDAYRRKSAGAVLARTISRTVITTYGRDFATANTLFERGGRTGRQSQTWVRMPEGWRVVAAHVSMLPER